MRFCDQRNRFIHERHGEFNFSAPQIVFFPRERQCRRRVHWHRSRVAGFSRRRFCFFGGEISKTSGPADGDGDDYDVPLDPVSPSKAEAAQAETEAPMKIPLVNRRPRCRFHPFSQRPFHRVSLPRVEIRQPRRRDHLIICSRDEI